MRNVGTNRTWTVRMSRTEAEGRSVWDNCPFKTGELVYLYVLDLPEMALRFGDYEARKLRADPGAGPLDLPGPPRWVNGPLKLGAPFTDTLVRVGCNLAVIPAWDRLFTTMQESSDLPAPTFGSDQGVDVRSWSFVEIWAAVAPGAAEELRAFPWLRHPTGFWGLASEFQAPASQSGHHMVVPCAHADRAYCQVTYTTTFSTGGGVQYGNLTPPPENVPTTSTTASEQVVRFGAVLAQEVH